MKLTIKNALKGLLLVPVIALSLSVALPNHGASAATTPTACTNNGGSDASLGAQGGADASCGTGQSKDLFASGGVFQTVTNVLLFIIGAISVIMLIIGGVRYTVSGGDSSAVTGAKNTILYAIVGIVVALLAYAVVNFVLGNFVAK